MPNGRVLGTTLRQMKEGCEEVWVPANKGQSDGSVSLRLGTSELSTSRDSELYSEQYYGSEYV